MGTRSQEPTFPLLHLALGQVIGFPAQLGWGRSSQHPLHAHRDTAWPWRCSGLLQAEQGRWRWQMLAGAQPELSAQPRGRGMALTRVCLCWAWLCSLTRWAVLGPPVTLQHTLQHRLLLPSVPHLWRPAGLGLSRQLGPSSSSLGTSPAPCPGGI